MDEMKPWQHGYDLDYLKSLEAFYSDYNAFARGPFATYKKNIIAADLHAKQLQLVQRKDKLVASYVLKKAKVPSKITMYQDVVIGRKQPGDVVVERLAGSANACKAVLADMAALRAPCWFTCWREDTAMCAMAERAGFKLMGVKITTFAELVAVYFKQDTTTKTFFKSNRAAAVDPVERVVLKKLATVPSKVLGKVLHDYQQAALEFADHYSNYNKGHSWSAVALRGYSIDPRFIAKPSEMSKKWKAEHADTVYAMQDTPLRRKFPSIMQLPFMNRAPDKVHRIRLMRLLPGGGELQRHTDQVDVDSGLRLGQLARLHFPIITNPDVRFTVWDTDGVETTRVLKTGECWVLDTRKPHRVINGGDTDRIHVVVDVVVNKELYQTFLQG